MKTSKWYSPLLLVLWLTVSTLSYGQNNLPDLGNTSANVASIAKEKILGKAWLRSLRKQVETYTNPVVENYLSNLVYRLAPNSEVLDRDFSLVIVNSPALNAFAVPGSIIGINAGLFIHAVTEQEFASVISHELAHLAQRHYARQLERQQTSKPLALAGILASVVVAAAAGSEAGLATYATSQAISADQQLRFSRQNEQEADRLGIETLHQSGFDPRAMPLLFERMMRNNRMQGTERPEYLSTHPLSENRIADSKNRAEQFDRRHYLDSLEYHICRSIILTDFAETQVKARNYFTSIIEKGNHPTLLASAKFGLAYTLLETAPEKAIELFDQLIKAHPDTIALSIYKAIALFKNDQQAAALNQLETLLKRNPNNYPIMDTLADLYLQSNKIKESELIMKQLSRIKPEHPKVWFGLAEINGLAGNIADLHLARAEYFFLNDRIDEAIDQLGLARKKSTSGQKTALIDQRMSELYQIKNNPLF